MKMMSKTLNGRVIAIKVTGIVQEKKSWFLHKCLCADRFFMHMAKMEYIREICKG